MVLTMALEDGHRGMADLLGGKGANLAEMTRLGLLVPRTAPSLRRAPAVSSEDCENAPGSATMR